MSILDPAVSYEWETFINKDAPEFDEQKLSPLVLNPEQDFIPPSPEPQVRKKPRAYVPRNDPGAKAKMRLDRLAKEFELDGKKHHSRNNKKIARRMRRLGKYCKRYY